MHIIIMLIHLTFFIKEDRELCDLDKKWAKNIRRKERVLVELGLKKVQCHGVCILTQLLLKL